MQVMTSDPKAGKRQKEVIAQEILHILWLAKIFTHSEAYRIEDYPDPPNSTFELLKKLE